MSRPALRVVPPAEPVDPATEPRPLLHPGTVRLIGDILLAFAAAMFILSCVALVLVAKHAAS